MSRSSASRREHVSGLLIRGITETTIAQELGVSRQTIVRDVAFLKKQAQRWVESLARGGFVFEYRLSLEKIKLNGKRLEELYDKVHDDRLKLDILREMDRNARLFLELLGETPTIHAFRKATGLKQIRDVSQA